MTKAQTNKFNSYPVDTGKDLISTYTTRQSLFRIWTPTADKAELMDLLPDSGTILYCWQVT